MTANSLGLVFGGMGGPQGPVGPQGLQGVGVSSITFNPSNSSFTFTMSDGSVQGPFSLDATTLLNILQLTLTGANNTNKLEVKDSSGAVVFNVDTGSDTVTVGGNLNGVSATQLTYLDSLTSNVQTQINSLTTGLGSYLPLAGGTVTGSTTFTDDVLINGAGSTNKFTVTQSGGATSFNVNTNTNAVTTQWNQLDDGAGNMGITGNMGIGGLTINSLVQSSASKNLISSNNLPSGSSATNMTLTSPTISNGTFTNTSTFNGTGTFNGMGSNNKLTVYNGGASVFNVDNIGSEVTTILNTLDDGLGNVAISGATNFNKLFTGSVGIGGVLSGSITLPPLIPYCYHYYASTIASGTSVGSLPLPGAATIKNVMNITGVCLENWNNTGNILTVPLNSSSALQAWSVTIGSTVSSTNVFSLNTGSSWNLSNGAAHFYIWFWVSSVNLTP